MMILLNDVSRCSNKFLFYYILFLLHNYRMMLGVNSNLSQCSYIIHTFFFNFLSISIKKISNKETTGNTENSLAMLRRGAL